MSDVRLEGDLAKTESLLTWPLGVGVQLIYTAARGEAAADVVTTVGVGRAGEQQRAEACLVSLDDVTERLGASAGLHRNALVVEEGERLLDTRVYVVIPGS
jgi:hypothetical protein